MSSPSRSVVATTAKSIVTAMKPHGGTQKRSILDPSPTICGARRTRFHGNRRLVPELNPAHCARRHDAPLRRQASARVFAANPRILFARAHKNWIRPQGTRLIKNGQALLL